MFVKNINEVKTDNVSVEGVKNAGMKWLIGEKDGAEHFYMRLAIIEKDGIVPLHNHPNVHEIYVVSGEGSVLLEGEEKPMKEGDFVFVEGDLVHGFKNTGDNTLKFICCINK